MCITVLLILKDFLSRFAFGYPNVFLVFFFLEFIEKVYESE